ncbi:MAG TPA: sulfotransferase [Aromatoleum sp.]|uniref:sulfotransferase n=1 Tax=Aromatoleum sp. TaxID=2307007 RepID=UPI002B496CBB|nr:sulfotransferase [Aromatoleum sp.]HJV28414.1 sulfotransferase [Aromatoleum sp.]
MSRRKVVFVMGNGHSGSTLLELILGGHPKVRALGELNNLHKAIDADEPDEPRLCHVCEGYCEFWNGQVDRATIARHVSQRGLFAPLKRGVSLLRNDLYRHLFTKSGAEILVDGSKSVSWISRQVRPRLSWGDVSPFLLYIVRDGRAVVNSRLRKYPDRSVEQEARHWKRITERLHAYYDKFPADRRHRVSYEDLATKPEEVIRGVCQALQIDFRPSMLRYWEHDHHTTFGNTGTRSLIARYRTQFGVADAPAAAESVEITRARHGEHYDQVGLAIRLDERWKRELSEEQLAAFDSIGGELNRRQLAFFGRS